MLIHHFDPIALSLGPLSITWYGLSYGISALLGLLYARWLTQKKLSPLPSSLLDPLMLWVLLSAVIGGRLGQVLFYQPLHFFHHPLEIFQTWKGGMSFHGGILGIGIALFLFSRRYQVPLSVLSDLVATTVPIGLGLGRIANFINGELVGEPTSLPWAVIFPRVDFLPRHPSQLYEAALEGVVLGVLLFIGAKCGWGRLYPWRLTGTFLISYGLFRGLVESVRMPELNLFLGLTAGQWWSVPMILFGCFLFVRTCRDQTIR